MIIAPSILTANMANLQAEIAILDKSSAPWLHLDIMDGVFVPNISFGFPVIKSIRPLTKKIFDAHLMIVQPEKYLSEFADLGVNGLTVHQENCIHLHRTLQAIKDLGMRAGVALNPHTPINTLEEIVCSADMILIMSVNPGFGGQKFIPECLDKIRRMKNLLIQKNSKALIQVDGGVNLNNAPLLKEAGADVLVVGNAIFASPSPIDTITQLSSL
ncbi:MAG: ribulose-phosphate 3-epimerase [Bacteroidales bacterium]